MTASIALLSTVIQVFCTLAILSFLYKDNPVYKFAEHLFVGVATGWWIVVQYRDTVLPNLYEPLKAGLLGKPMPEATKLHWATLFVPLAFGLLLLMRLAPKGSYLARWSMAAIVGTFSGLAVVGFGSGDLYQQIDSNIVPFFAPGSLQALGRHLSFATLLEVLRNPVLVVGCIAVLVYFFFSVPHKGAVGGIATIGTWFLMVSFGASYGSTVMARISLFIGRARYLFVEKTGTLDNAWVTLAVAVVLIAILATWERRPRTETGREG